MKDTRGFTIVEVLVAVVVLTVGLLGTLSTFGSATRTFWRGHSFVEASAEAASLLEGIRAAACHGAGVGATTGSSGNLAWRIHEVGPDLRRVTVVVTPDMARDRADTFSALLPC